MEAPPSSTLVAIETDPLLKVLEVALDAQHSLAVSTSVSIGVVAGSGESQYLVAASSPSGHLVSVGCRSLPSPARQQGGRFRWRPSLGWRWIVSESLLRGPVIAGRRRPRKLHWGGGPTIDWLDISTGAGSHNITLGKGIFLHNSPASRLGSRRGWRS